MCTSLYINDAKYLFMYIFIHIYVYMYTYVCMYVYICINMYLHKGLTEIKSKKTQKIPQKIKKLTTKIIQLEISKRTEYFPKEDVQMTTSFTKKCLTSLIIRGIQIHWDTAPHLSEWLLSTGNSVQCYAAAWMLRGVWGRMDACKCMVESLCCSPETFTTLLTGYTPIHNKKCKSQKGVNGCYES